MISGVYFNFVIGVVSQNIDSPTNPVRFNRHEHQERDDAHTGHDCQFCLVHSYTLPLLDTKLRLVLIRTQTLLQFFSTFVPYTLSLPHPWFLIPQGRAPPLTLIH
ncbi:DUF2946 family protein [Acinetobacter sp.]|uniref:DUF2946 family protein n=1 Tax=Acinetobacter sp. TaxID=472 RepID=UPI00338E1CD3